MEALGRKFAMDTACLFFGLGTVACALSDNIYMLIAARGLAGVSGVLPCSVCTPGNTGGRVVGRRDG
jgi:predicted MFS family arabinose efflux permease